MTTAVLQYEPKANADLDCDGTLSTFQRQGKINASSGDVEAAGAAYVDKEIE